MFDSTPGVCRLDPANPRLPAAGLVALLDVLDVTPDHVRLLAGIDLTALDDMSQLVVLKIWHRVAAWVSAQEQRSIVVVAGARRTTRDDWSREEVAAALHIAPSTALKRIIAARELVGRLQETWAALATGRISYWHAAHLAATVSDFPAEVAATVEAAVLPRAGGQTYGQFRRAVAEAVAAADPASLQERHTIAAERRDVKVWDEPDGMATLVTTGPAPQIYEIYDRVARLAAVRVAGDNDRRVGARRFDALVECMSGDPAGAVVTVDTEGAEGGNCGGRGRGARRQVGILLDLPTALGLADHPGELPGYGPVPASVARAFAADGEWHAWLVDAAKAHLIGLGTQAYRPGSRLREFIEARDRTCRHPGCRQPAWRCDIDHALPYDAGGCTDPTNCGCFCRRHHRLKHETTWQVERQPDGVVQFTSPRGARHTVEPPDYRWMLTPPQPHVSTKDQAALEVLEVDLSGTVAASDDPPF